MLVKSLAMTKNLFHEKVSRILINVIKSFIIKKKSIEDILILKYFVQIHPKYFKILRRSP